MCFVTILTISTLVVYASNNKDCCRFMERHTAVNTADQFRTITAAIGINKVTRLITDNAANIRAGVSETERSPTSCFGHVLLSAKNSLKFDRVMLWVQQGSPWIIKINQFCTAILWSQSNSLARPAAAQAQLPCDAWTATVAVSLRICSALCRFLRQYAQATPAIANATIGSSVSH